MISKSKAHLLDDITGTQQILIVGSKLANNKQIGLKNAKIVVNFQGSELESFSSDSQQFRFPFQAHLNDESQLSKQISIKLFDDKQEIGEMKFTMQTFMMYGADPQSLIKSVKDAMYQDKTNWFPIYKNNSKVGELKIKTEFIHDSITSNTMGSTVFEGEYDQQIDSSGSQGMFGGLSTGKKAAACVGGTAVAGIAAYFGFGLDLLSCGGAEVAGTKAAGLAGAKSAAANTAATLAGAAGQTASAAAKTGAGAFALDANAWMGDVNDWKDMLPPEALAALNAKTGAGAAALDANAMAMLGDINDWKDMLPPEALAALNAKTGAGAVALDANQMGNTWIADDKW